MDMINLLSITLLGISICFYGVDCGGSFCYENYMKCYETFEKVPVPQSFMEDWATFCDAVDTIDTCLKNDVIPCGPNDPEPQNYANYVSIVKDRARSCKVAACTQLQLNCSMVYSNSVSFINMSAEITPDDLARMCQALPLAKTCYSNYLTECNEPGLTEGIDQTLQGIDQQLNSCQQQASGKCLEISLGCVTITQEISPAFQNLTFDDPSAMLQQISVLCPVFGRMKKCYNDLSTTCPRFVNNTETVLNSFGIIDQFCSNGSVNCATKLQQCAAPLAQFPKCSDSDNFDKLSLSDGINCCKLAADTTKCIRDGGCEKLINGDPSILKSEAICRGYNDYCPGMFECFNATYQNGAFNDPTAVCRNIGGFLTCIEGKCSDKSQMGKQTLTKIKDVFTGICGVVGKYPSIVFCDNFTSCLDKAPSLPGNVMSIQSFVSARNSDRWCQIAKSYVSCGAKVADQNMCNLSAAFDADVSAIQTTAYQTCSGVPGPCLPVHNCIGQLMSNQNEMQFKKTCPNIPSFMNCTDDALSTCGEGSRVKADYGLFDIKDLYVKTCEAMSDELYQCKFVNTCLDMQIPSDTGDMIVELADQTSWCRKLNRMVKCTADVYTVCSQPKTVHDKFMMLYHEVSKHCPSQYYQSPQKSTTPDPTVGDGGGAADSIRVTGVLVMITAFCAIFY